MSKTVDILDLLTKTIRSNDDFKRVPVYWDETELSVNSAVLPCVMLKPQEWVNNGECDGYERILEVRILHNGQDRRQTLIQLWEFEEKLRKIIDELIWSDKADWFELTENGGSAMSIWAYQQKNQDSEKRVSTLFSSALVIFYKLRY